MSSSILFGPFRIDAGLDLLFRGETVVPLEPVAVRVVRYLAERPGKVVSKQELLDKIWPDVFTTEAVLKKSVSLARRALGDDAGEPHFIETHHRRGYRFIAPVSAGSTTEPAASVAAPRTAPDFNPFVGRENELAALEAEYQAALDGAGRLVVITGEAGIGKTQLARHFRATTVRESARWLSARFFDYQGSRLAPYETFLDLLASAAGLERSRGAGALRTHAAEHWGVTLPEELFVAATGAAPIGLGDNRFRVLVPVADCFVRVSRERPLVLLFDDLQWADETAQDVIGYLMRTAQAEKMLLVGTCRSEALNDATHPVRRWLERQATYRAFTTLHLKPLAEPMCRRAIDAVFGGTSDAAGVTTDEARTLHRRTGGNPYFLMEILRLLVVDGVIAPDPERAGAWRCRGLGELHLPATLVMAARETLQRLRPELRAALEAAAVIGDEFQAATLAAMLETAPATLADLLSDAIRAGALSRQPLTAGEDFRFHHEVLREVLYNDLDPSRRQRLHASAARALESVYGSAADRVANAASAHCEAAGDRRGALHWGLRAWQAARDRWQWPEALAAITRAHRAATSPAAPGEATATDVQRRAVRIALAEAYAATGQYKEAEPLLTDLATRPGAEDEETAAVWLLLSEVRTGLSRYAEATADAERAAALYKRKGQTERWARAVLQSGAVQVALGRYEEGARGAALALTAGGEETAAHASALLGWARAIEGRFAEGAPLLQRAADFYARVGDFQRRARVLRRLHWVQLSRGRYEEAIALARQAEGELRRADDRSSEAKCAMGIGQARVAQGLYAEGLELLERVLQTVTEIGDAHCEAETLWLQARAELGLGRPEAAETRLARALAMVREIGDRDDEFRMLTDVARLRLRQGADAAALAAAEEAVRIAEELHNRDGLGLALVEQARALLRLSRTNEAEAAIAKACALLDETGSGEAWRADWVLGQVREAAGGDAQAPLRQAVERLDEIRRQLPSEDEARRAAVTRAHGGPAGDLRRLARGAGRSTEAEALARAWALTPPA